MMGSYAAKVSLVYHGPPDEPAKLRIDRALNGVPGIKHYLVTDSRRIVRVFYDPEIIQRERLRFLCWELAFHPLTLHDGIAKGTVGPRKLSARFFFHQRYIPIAMFATERFGEAHHVIGPFLLLFWRAPAHNLRHIGCVTITFCHFPFTIHQSVPVIAAADPALWYCAILSCHSPRSQPGTIIPRVLPGLRENSVQLPQIDL